jgi:cytidylate kinase
MTKGFIVAIDGPVAAGKGTIAPLLAKKLNGFYLYTGATYRCLALFCIENSIDVADHKSVIQALSHVHIELTGEKVFLNGKDVTDRLKERDVANAVSEVSTIAEVRKVMVERQQEIVAQRVKENQVVVSEGRDTGTVVFPNADVKFFLTASPKVRAKRRLAQLHNQGDTSIDLPTLVKEIESRDTLDTTRKADPLATNPERVGYTVIDNSDLDEEQTLNFLVDKIKDKGLLL